MTKRWIVVGFALIFIGELFQFIHEVQGGLLGQGDVRVIVEQLLQPVGGLFAATGWWFLSQLHASDDAQRRLIASGFLFVGLDLASSAAVGFMYLWDISFFHHSQWETWLQMVGAAVAAGGFIATWIRMRKSTSLIVARHDTHV